MKMKKSTKIILAVGGLVFVVGVIFFISRRATEKQSLTPYESPTSGESTTKLSQQNKNVLESENSQVYRSEEYGFEIQYPPSWTLREYGNGTIGFFLSEPETLFKYTGDILIRTYPNPENLPVDKFVLKNFSFSGWAAIPITIDGQQWFWDSNNRNTLHGPSAEVSREGYYYIIQTKNGLFEEEGFKEFLSGVTFSKPEPITKNITTNNVIIEGACGYKITLPPGWTFKKGVQCHELVLRANWPDQFISPQNKSIHLLVYEANFTEEIRLSAIEKGDIEVTEFTINGYRALRFPADDEGVVDFPTAPIVTVEFPDKVLNFTLNAPEGSDSEREMFDIITSLQVI